MLAWEGSVLGADVTASLKRTPSPAMLAMFGEEGSGWP